MLPPVRQRDLLIWKPVENKQLTDPSIHPHDLPQLSLGLWSLLRGQAGRWGPGNAPQPQGLRVQGSEDEHCGCLCCGGFDLSGGGVVFWSCFFSFLSFLLLPLLCAVTLKVHWKCTIAFDDAVVLFLLFLFFFRLFFLPRDKLQWNIHLQI